MNTPIESVDAIRRLLPNGGSHFALREAVDAMQRSYLVDQLLPTAQPGANEESSEEDDADSLIIVAGKYSQKTESYVEIGLFRSFGLFTQLEVSLRYPTTLRSLFLKHYSDFCNSQDAATRFFQQFRASSWYWRYQMASAARCSIVWRGLEEMASIYTEVLPVLRKNGCLSSECAIK